MLNQQLRQQLTATIVNIRWLECTTDEVNRAHNGLVAGSSPAGPNFGLFFCRGRPFRVDPMRMWPISTRVNKPENDDPSILEPIKLDAA